MLFPELLEPLFAYGEIHADLEEVVVFMQMHKTLRLSVFPASKEIQAFQDSWGGVTKIISLQGVFPQEVVAKGSMKCTRNMGAFRGYYQQYRQPAREGW